MIIIIMSFLSPSVCQKALSDRSYILHSTHAFWAIIANTVFLSGFFSCMFGKMWINYWGCIKKVPGDPQPCWFTFKRIFFFSCSEILEMNTALSPFVLNSLPCFYVIPRLKLSSLFIIQTEYLLKNIYVYITNKLKCLSSNIKAVYILF